MPGTGKKHRILTSGQLFLSVLILFMLPVWEAQGAGFTAKTSFSVQEQYNDNIFLTDKDRTTDYITRALPSLALDYKAPLWNWDLSYTLDYRHYLDHSVADNFAHDLNFHNSTELVKKSLFIDVSDTYTKASLSLLRDYTQVSLFVNQSDRNAFTVTPHFTLRPSSSTTVDTGYTYQNIWYKSSAGVKKTDNIVYTNATVEMSPLLEFTAGGQYLMDQNNIQDYSKLNFYAGPKYTYSPDSYFFFKFGNSLYDFRRSGSDDEWSWDAGINHEFATFSASLEASSQDIDNPSDIISKIDTYTASLASKGSVTPCSVAVTYSEYSDLSTQKLTDRTYGLTGTISRSFTEMFTGAANLTVKRIEDKLAGSHSNLLISGLNFSYAMSPKASLTFNYQFAYSHSPVIITDRYLNNQVMAGISITL
ncbi:MAG: TIGR03016 family PEP-CTERM system-associated outer membrane protein [Nitrospiraceae bacterium]|nr:TIGR03016 family PEP-CTERM system-associated outer membrane protein [Nitrospiraceae bacterium]